MTAVCDHKWVHLQSEGVKEVGYRCWVKVELFFCEKCLEYKRIEVEPHDGMKY